MLLMQHPVFRRFWYPTLAISELRSGPKRIHVAGRRPRPVDAGQRPARRAAGPLSPPSRQIVGRQPRGRRRLAMRVSRLAFRRHRTMRAGPADARAQPGHQERREELPLRGTIRLRMGLSRTGAAARYAPISGIPTIRPSARSFEYVEDWNANMLVVCENALDIGHISFVHRRTFGNDQKPAAPRVSTSSSSTMA